MFKKKKITGILEIGKSFLKLVVIEEDFKKNRIITKLLKRDLTSEKSIAGILSEENISFDDLIIVLSRAQVTVRNLELPTADPQEIKDIISIQASKQTPFSRDEIIFDFQAIGSIRSHYTKVLLAIVQKTIVNSYLDSLADKKEIIQKIVLTSECHANYYSIIRNKVKDETFAIFDFDGDFCDFSVYSNGKLLFTRFLSLDISDLSEKNWEKDFLGEIGNFLNTYKKENIGPVFNKVVLMGPDPVREKVSGGAKDILAKHFSLEVFSPFEEMEGISFSEEAKIALDRGNKEGVSFSKLIGLALNPGKLVMDFLPLGLKQARLVRIRRKELMLVGILMFSLLILGEGIFLERIYAKTLLLKRLNAQFVKLEKETSGLKKEDLRIRLIKERTDATDSAIELLREIHKVAPQEIYLAAITFEEGKILSLRGTSKDMSCVFKLVKTLEELPIFKDVKTKYITKRKLKDKDLTDFEITCPLVRD